MQDGTNIKDILVYDRSTSVIKVNPMNQTIHNMTDIKQNIFHIVYTAISVNIWLSHRNNKTGFMFACL